MINNCGHACGGRLAGYAHHGVKNIGKPWTGYYKSIETSPLNTGCIIIIYMFKVNHFDGWIVESLYQRGRSCFIALSPLHPQATHLNGPLNRWIVEPFNLKTSMGRSPIAIGFVVKPPRPISIPISDFEDRHCHWNHQLRRSLTHAGFLLQSNTA